MIPACVGCRLRGISVLRHFPADQPFPPTARQRNSPSLFQVTLAGWTRENDKKGVALLSYSSCLAVPLRAEELESALRLCSEVRTMRPRSQPGSCLAVSALGGLQILAPGNRV